MKKIYIMSLVFLIGLASYAGMETDEIRLKDAGSTNILKSVGGYLKYNGSAVLTNGYYYIYTVDTSASSVTNTLPTPTSTTPMFVYNKTNALNSLVLVYGSSTQTINGIAMVKCYPDFVSTNWITEY